MTVGFYLRQATATLAGRSSSPRLDAEILLAHILHLDRAQLLTRQQVLVTPTETQILKSLILQRVQRVPIPYLTGRQEFFGLSLEATPDVLIPRPATELLVEAVLKHLPADTTMTIADVGTGSGAIALALAKHLPQATIIASDVSLPALAVANRNAQRLGLSHRITFLKCSLLESYELQLPKPALRVRDPDFRSSGTSGLQPNFVIANLPYLRPDQLLEPSIQHEPRLALDGGVGGLNLVNQLIEQLAAFPALSGLALELDPQQIKTTAALVSRIWPNHEVIEITDGQVARGLLSW